MTQIYRKKNLATLHNTSKGFGPNTHTMHRVYSAVIYLTQVVATGKGQARENIVQIIQNPDQVPIKAQEVNLCEYNKNSSTQETWQADKEGST